MWSAFSLSGSRKNPADPRIWAAYLREYTEEGIVVKARVPEIYMKLYKNILKNKENTIYCAFFENEEHYVVFCVLTNR